MQQKLVKVGYWKDIRNLPIIVVFDPRPDPRELVEDVFNEETRTTIAHYLDHGRKVETYLGYSYCRFGCKDADMGCSDLSDGTFVWPEGLSHYVRVHHVMLPSEFLKHILLSMRRRPG